MTQRKQYGGGWFDVVVDNSFGLVFLSLPEAGERGIVWAQLHVCYGDENSYACSACWGYDTVLPHPWWKWWLTDLPTVMLKATVWLEQVDASERVRAATEAATIEVVKECLASPGD